MFELNRGFNQKTEAEHQLHLFFVSLVIDD